MVLVGWYCWNNVRPLRDSCLRHRSEGTPSRRRLVCWDGLQMSEMHIPSITCIQYIHYMYIVCMLHVYVIFYVCYTYTICILHACYVLYVSYMYPICIYIYAKICVAASGAFFGLGVLLGLSYGAPKLGSSLWWKLRGGEWWKTRGKIWEICGEIWDLRINK